ncbi:RNA recognition motif domain [Macleaya cordata]|uniref:RNA recognition motif domain n=1 Tax=Macleaya cordata TaxID=56857 RepID=A0A200Q068_MACCD|nr:RNA recognition motif domain [Macleaya cordata]
MDLAIYRYMQINPGIFPKATKVQNEVGGSWYLLKDILKDLKEKMLSSLQVKKQSPSERLDEMVDTVISEARITGDSLDIADVDKLKSRVQPSASVTEPLHEKDISTVPLHVAEKPFGDIVNSEDPSNCVKLVESREVDEFDPNSHRVLAHVTEDIPSAAIVKSEDPSNCVKPVNSRNGDVVEANSSRVFAPDGDHRAASAELSLVRELVSGEEKETRTLGISVEMTSVENEDHSSNKKVTTCMAPNGTSKAKETHSSSGGAEKIIRLADLFMKQKMDTTLSDNDSLAHEISSNFSKESSGDVSKRKDIKGLIDRIKKLDVDTSNVSSHDSIITNKMNQLKNGSPPKDKSATPFTLGTSKISDLDKQQKSRSEPYTCDVHKKHIQDERQMKKPKEINLPHLILQDKEKDTLTKKDDSVTCNRTNLLDDNEEDPTEQVPFETFNLETSRHFDCESSSVYIKPEPSPKSPQPNKRAPQKRDINQFLFTAKGKNQTILLVRFLRKLVNTTEIEDVFKDCGPITEIRFIQSKNESSFKDAYICFKTKEGLQRALAKTDVVVRGTDVVVSPADPSTSMPNKILPPNVVEDPEVPAALLENPTRTVMLKCLPHDLASHHLREAFSFCGGQISSFFMGASNSVAYVEFETEDAKEKAIAASSVTVLGNQNSVLRIDVPITTVIRISNVLISKGTNVRTTCSLHGQVKRVLERGSDTVDVHFKLAEWPNMVKILNSLNGLVVNERQWIAQPAPVIPVKILHTLWNKQDGRRQVTVKDF